MEELIKINDLKVRFNMLEQQILAARGVSFNIKKGQTLGLVGESGCGKSVTALSILRLVSPPGKIYNGSITYKGDDLLTCTENEMRKVRGNEIGMIFQEPMTSLNPVFTIGYQVSEVLKEHKQMTKREALGFSAELLNQVGIPNATERLKSYPHEFSGGMRQRVMIAMALAASPSLLIADEPTTALDVTIQAQILDLLLELQEKHNMAMLLITHDLGIVANVADEIAIMYAGEIIEQGTALEVFESAKHPYTQGLFDSIPRIGDLNKKLKTIPGSVPVIDRDIKECTFYPRCPIHIGACLENPVAMQGLTKSHSARCIKAK